MITDDLIVDTADKDTTKSCIFDWPDRPPDTFPPGYPPVDPPDCYPYCASDDWPPPPPLPPIVIPPDAEPHGIDYEVTTGRCKIVLGRGVGINFRLNLTINSIPPIDVSTGNPSGTFLGGAGTALDHAIGYFSNSEEDSVDIFFPTLLSYLNASDTPVIRITYEATLDTDQLNLGVAYSAPHQTSNRFLGTIEDIDFSEDPIVELNAFSFPPPPLNFNYTNRVKWEVYFQRSTGIVYSTPLDVSSGIYTP